MFPFLTLSKYILAGSEICFLFPKIMREAPLTRTCVTSRTKCDVNRSGSEITKQITYVTLEKTVSDVMMIILDIIFNYLVIARSWGFCRPNSERAYSLLNFEFEIFFFHLKWISLVPKIQNRTCFPFFLKITSLFSWSYALTKKICVYTNKFLLAEPAILLSSIY